MRFASIAAPARFGVCLAAALLAGAADGWAGAPPLAVEASSAGNSARLRFLWPDRVAAQAGAEGDAVVVTLDREVDARAVRDAATMLPGWLASAEAEGQRLRLVPKPGRSATVIALPRGVEVRLAGAEARPTPQVAAAPAAPKPPPTQPLPAAATAAPAPPSLPSPSPPSRAPPSSPPALIGAITVVPGLAAVVAEAPGVRAPAVAPAVAPPPTDAEAAAAERRLRLTKARLMMETGDAEGAKAELEALLREVPSSVEVIAALASVESQLGGWRRAVGLYDRALGLNPDDPGLIRAKAELLREFGPRARLDIDHRKVKKGDRQIVARASGEALAGSTVTGFAFEANDLDAPVVRRLDGTLPSFDGRRFRGEGYVALDHEAGGLTRLSLIGGTGIVGAAIRHTRQTSEGTVRLGLILQDPYWDVVDGLVNEARTDRAQVGFEKILGTSWRVAGRLAAGRYGVKGRSDVAHFVGPGFEVSYTAMQGPPSLTFAYGMDGEYLASRKVAVDALGLEYPLLSVVSREVHSGTAGLSGSLSSESRFNLYGGYAFDRLNSSGPFFGADIAFEPYAAFEFGLAASHSLTASRGTDSTVTRIGGYLLWRF